MGIISCWSNLNDEAYSYNIFIYKIILWAEVKSTNKNELSEHETNRKSILAWLYCIFFTFKF